MAVHQRNVYLAIVQPKQTVAKPAAHEASSVVSPDAYVWTLIDETLCQPEGEALVIAGHYTSSGYVYRVRALVRYGWALGGWLVRTAGSKKKHGQKRKNVWYRVSR